MVLDIRGKMNMHKDIRAGVFRAYDIRGIVGEGMNESLLYAVGRAFATEVLKANQTAVIVGYDARESSEPFQKALCKALQEGGVDVINIGVVPTPVLYFATTQLKTQSGIMITGSHNPSNYNGIKLVLAGKTINTDAIQGLYQRILAEDFSQGTGEYSEVNLIDDYVKTIADRVHLKRPMKIVVDAGNGVGALTAKKVYQALGCEVIELYCEVDGHFPNHHPDPTIVENLQDLIAKVKEHEADIGLGFDGDADRVGVVTNTGTIIWPDRFLMLLCKDVLTRYPGAKIPFDVKCSGDLARVIKEAGGNPVMWKTGHSILKAKMYELDAPIAGELSGHVFYRDQWFGFDDGVYVGARLLDVLSKDERSVDAIFSDLPDNINTPELKVAVPEAKKFKVVDDLIASMTFDNAEVTTIDGLRVDFADAWFLVRASNTTPCLTVRFEAATKDRLSEIQVLVRDALIKVDSSLEISF